jgi:hypothetical protein
MQGMCAAVKIRKLGRATQNNLSRTSFVDTELMPIPAPAYLY